MSYPEANGSSRFFSFHLFLFGLLLFLKALDSIRHTGKQARTCAFGHFAPHYPLCVLLSSLTNFLFPGVSILLLCLSIAFLLFSVMTACRSRSVRIKTLSAATLKKMAHIPPATRVEPRECSSPMMEFWQVQPSADLMQISPVALSSWVQRWCHVQKMLFGITLLQHPALPFYLLFWLLHESWRG